LVKPRHVALILDGNRRWARERGLPAIEGHRAGARALCETVRTAARAGIEILTPYVFSEEDRQRDASEVRSLMELITHHAASEREAWKLDNVRVHVIGRRDRLPASTQAALRELVEETSACTGLLLNLAIDYGARAELCEAVRALARDVRSGALKAVDVDETTLDGYLYTAGLPEPDLIVRTGGELRLSNFLLYQAAYSELWSTTAYWPDCGAAALDQAMEAFAKRRRRFGS
jgi:undecaprenyl diphosphate synthase